MKPKQVKGGFLTREGLKLHDKLLRDRLVKEIKEEITKNYLCDFNWDFEKNKPRNKSYVAVGDIFKILEKLNIKK